jgi:hypothetical protein
LPVLQLILTFFLKPPIGWLVIDSAFSETTSKKPQNRTLGSTISLFEEILLRLVTLFVFLAICNGAR